VIAGPAQVVAAATGVTRFALRNAPDLLAFGRDALLGRAGRLPPARRVLLRFESETHVVVDGELVTSPLGSGPPAPTTAGVPGPGPDAASVSAVLGLCNRDGPVPLPVRWNGGTARGWVPSVLVEATGADAGPGDLALDEYRAPGPAAKHGRLLRGTVEWAAPGPGRWRAFRLKPERVTRWSGVETETRRPA
jgi:hypothetical protein